MGENGTSLFYRNMLTDNAHLVGRGLFRFLLQ